MLAADAHFPSFVLCLLILAALLQTPASRVIENIHFKEMDLEGEVSKSRGSAVLQWNKI